MTSGRAGHSIDRPEGRGTPFGLHLLTAAVLCTALVAAVVGLSLPARLPVDDPLGGPARFGIAVAAFALSQLARLRFRAAAGVVSVTWAEAALIVCLYLVPPGWLPAAAMLGVALAWTAMTIVDEGRTTWEVARIAGAQTAAVALAVAVTTAIGQPLLAP